MSDKAISCPHCGEPNDSLQSDAPSQLPHESRKRGWIWASIALAVLLAAGGLTWWLGSRDKTASNDAVVEITPQFIEAVHQYDELYPFSEGLAAIKKDGKFGFINTKGELVIPCQFERVSPFADGLSIVMDEEYKISILCRNGELKHTAYKLDAGSYGYGGWHGDKGYYSFRFQNKYCRLKTENSEDEIVIDENGKKCVNIPDYDFVEDGFYASSDTICKKPILLKFPSEKHNIFGIEETYYGIKDSSNKIIVPAQYTHIGEYSNGVAQCIIFVGDAESKGAPYGIHLPAGEYFFGYIDEIGNTTFTDEDLKKIKEYGNQQLDQVKQKEQAELEIQRREQEAEEERRRSEGIPMTITLDADIDNGDIINRASNMGLLNFNYGSMDRLATRIITVPAGKIYTYKHFSKGDRQEWKEIRIMVSRNGGSWSDIDLVRSGEVSFYEGDKFYVEMYWPLYRTNNCHVSGIFYFVEKETN